jgi:hypothetical protein
MPQNYIYNFAWSVNYQLARLNFTILSFVKAGPSFTKRAYSRVKQMKVLDPPPKMGQPGEIWRGVNLLARASTSCPSLRSNGRKIGCVSWSKAYQVPCQLHIQILVLCDQLTCMSLACPFFLSFSRVYFAKIWSIIVCERRLNFMLGLVPDGPTSVKEQGV